MSISLWIRQADGARTEVPITNQHRAEVEWVKTARELRLRHYDGVFPMLFDASTLDEIIEEFQRLHDVVAEGPPGSEDRLGRLLKHLKELRSKTGWEAYIG